MTTLHSWGPRVLWAMFALATCFALYIFVTDYARCRSGGGSNLVCFVSGVAVAYIKLAIFAVVSLYHLLQLILP